MAIGRIEYALKDAGTAGRGDIGTVRIGIFTSLASRFLAELLQAYQAKHPFVHLDLIEDGPAEHIVAVRHHRMDVAFLAGKPTDFLLLERLDCIKEHAAGIACHTMRRDPAANGHQGIRPHRVKSGSYWSVSAFPERPADTGPSIPLRLVVELLASGVDCRTIACFAVMGSEGGLNSALRGLTGMQAAPALNCGGRSAG
jgi:DNA-binding transcriptional LysR family regulator